MFRYSFRNPARCFTYYRSSGRNNGRQKEERKMNGRISNAPYQGFYLAAIGPGELRNLGDLLGTASADAERSRKSWRKRTQNVSHPKTQPAALLGCRDGDRGNPVRTSPTPPQTKSHRQFASAVTRNS